MKAPDFAYLRPDSLEEAIAALARLGDEATVLAGGQSLMPMLNLRATTADVLVDINRIAGLDAIEDAGDHLAIGALARHADLEASPLVREHLPLVAAALPFVAHPAVRNRGTLGGSLALADPAAELPACCLALGAELELAGPAGRRRIRIEDWFLGLYTTALEPGELLVTVRIPKAAPGSVHRFLETARRHGDFAIAGVAFSAVLREGTVHAPRIALLGVADRPVLAGSCMERLAGARPGAVDADVLASALACDTDPPEDPATPAAYRRHALGVLLRRVLASLEIEP